MAPKETQPRLPGTEDSKIQELQDAALEYAEIRDQRMELSKQEAPLKEKLLSLMKKNKLKHYHFANVEITVVVEEETVKVKVTGDEDGEGK